MRAATQSRAQKTALLDGLGAVGAACGVVTDHVVLVGAEAAVAGLANGLRNGGDLKGGVHDPDC
jgi:hypothetical protein